VKRGAAWEGPPLTITSPGQRKKLGNPFTVRGKGRVRRGGRTSSSRPGEKGLRSKSKKGDFSNPEKKRGNEGGTKQPKKKKLAHKRGREEGLRAEEGATSEGTMERENSFVKERKG